MAHPDRVSGLVLVDSVGMPAPREGKGPPLIFKLLRNPLGRAILRRADPRPLAVPGLRQGYVDATLVTDDLVDRYVELARAPGHRALLLSGQAAPRTPMSPAAFAAIKAPTLIMHGEADTVIPVEAGRGLARAIPGAELVTWPGVGHVPMEQIPQRSGDVLSAFLGRLPAVAEGTGGAGEAP
jgi:pimeloyl-ACP methyl ester carboxylesterase